MAELRESECADDLGGEPLLAASCFDVCIMRNSATFGSNYPGLEIMHV